MTRIKIVLALLVLVGIASACSPDPVINITTTTNHYYSKKVNDSVGIITEFPILTDTIN